MGLKKSEVFFLVLVAITALVPRLWRINTDLQIHYDQGLHSTAVWKIWHDGRLSLLGHPTDTDGIFHGPLYYWLMAPSYFLGAGDPASAAVFQILLGIAGLPFLYLLAKNLFDTKTACLTSLLFAVSYGYISYARWLSNVTPALPFSIVFVWLLFKKKLPAAFFMASVITQLNGAIGVFLYPAAVWTLITSQKKDYLKSFFYFLLPHIPLLLFEIRHNFVVTKAIINFSSQSSGISLAASVFFGNVSTLATELFHLTSYPFIPVTAVLLIAVLLIPKPRFIVMYVLSFFLTVSLYRRGAIGFFLVPLFPMFTILFSRVLLSFPKIISAAVIFLILGINIYHWKSFWSPSLALTPIGTANLITNQDRKNIVDWIYKQSSGRSFSVWIYTIPYYLTEPWTYYFTWYGRSEYGYLPQKIDNFSPGELPPDNLFFAIYEPDWIRPEKLANWLSDTNKHFGPPLSSFNSHSAAVNFHRVSDSF